MNAAVLVERLLDDLTDRRGFRQVWDEIDLVTRNEIKCAWKDIIDAEITADAAANAEDI